MYRLGAGWEKGIESMFVNVRKAMRGIRRRAAMSALFAGCLLLPLSVSSINAAEVVSADDKQIEIAVSDGQLIRLPRAASTVFIANPEIADVQVKSPTLVYLVGSNPGKTTLFAVDSRERILANMDIHVTHNLNALRSDVNSLIPENNISIASVNNALVVDGDVESPVDAQEVNRLALRYGDVVNRLKVTQPTQVNLRVRVAEVTRDIDKQLGFRWNLVEKISIFPLTLVTENPFRSSVTTHSLTLAGSRGSTDINTVIDAMEQEGLVSILAEPNLTALSGETASFLAGGEFPILVPEGSDRVTIEFKEYGVSLAFTPTILTGNRINMHVRPEVSQLSSTNSVTLDSYDIPSLTTRRAETTVELASGQSFAIAGLLQNNITQDVSKFPGLGDIPVLGALFRSDRFQRDETELVIIVTPYLVKPVSNRKLAEPTDGFMPPHDVERFFGKGVFRRNPKKNEPVTIGRNGQGLIGPAGFELN